MNLAIAMGARNEAALEACYRTMMRTPRGVPRRLRHAL